MGRENSESWHSCFLQVIWLHTSEHQDLSWWLNKGCFFLRYPDGSDNSQFAQHNNKQHLQKKHQSLMYIHLCMLFFLWVIQVFFLRRSTHPEDIHLHHNSYLNLLKLERQHFEFLQGDFWVPHQLIPIL